MSERKLGPKEAQMRALREASYAAGQRKTKTSLADLKGAVDAVKARPPKKARAKKTKGRKR